MADYITDLEECIKRWVYDYRMYRTYGYGYDELYMDINMDRVTYTFDKPTFSKGRKTPVANAHVVYTSNYTNDTDDSQEVDITVKRVTSATAKASIKHGFEADFGAGLKIPLPKEVVGTFGGNVSVDAEDETKYEKKMTWGFSTKMVAPPRRKTVAKFEINEEHMTCDFSTYAHLYGKVEVVVMVKATGEQLLVVCEALSTILDEYLPKANEFSVKKNIIYLDRVGNSALWPIRGRVDCKYGISQNEVIE